MMDDETVAQFVAVTGAAPARAEQYLQVTDSNLEQAIQLWYETGGIDMMESSTSAAPAAPPPAAPEAATSRVQPPVVNLDSEDEGDVEYLGSTVRGEAGVPPPAEHQPEEDDEAMARRLQEEMYAGGDVGGSDPDGVRAPIARTTETLVGPDPYDLGNPNDRAAAVAEQMLRRRQAMSRAPGGRAPSIWDQSEDYSARMRARAADAVGEEAQASRKTTMLAEMFRPPFELMSRLSWDEARDEGKSSERWIIVNVQDPSIFDCQLLNRDIWKHEGIRETVQEHFIFLQYAKDDPRGAQYMQYYFQHRDADSAYPHIAIVDPRTGEQVKVWSGPPAPKSMDFLMQLHEFLDRYSLHAAAKNPVARRKPDPPPSADRIDRMTEDEQLELAMQASLAGAAGPSTGAGEPSAAAPDPDELTRSISDLKANSSNAASGATHLPSTAPASARHDTPMADAPPVASGAALATPPPEPPSGPHPTFAAIPADRLHEEPEAGAPGTTRIQFRHPEGRVVRRFALGDPVQRLYEWLKSTPLPGLEGKEFALSFMGRNLLSDVEADNTIEGAGLRNGSVNVEVVEPA